MAPADRLAALRQRLDDEAHIWSPPCDHQKWEASDWMVSMLITFKLGMELPTCHVVEASTPDGAMHAADAWARDYYRGVVDVTATRARRCT